MMRRGRFTCISWKATRLRAVSVSRGCRRLLRRCATRFSRRREGGFGSCRSPSRDSPDGLLKKLPGVLILLTCGLSPTVAQRRPVLPQIDLPHAYYFREMYLPQLTSGPSSVAWSPDSREVVYSMAGSLWRQKVDSSAAEQLTDGAGYDYQPDWSPDGRYIVYASAQGEAIELWLLDLSSGRTRQLTQGGAVNVEPRWSPQGRRGPCLLGAYPPPFLLFVSQEGAGLNT